jgi:hypothetical protein
VRRLEIAKINVSERTLKIFFILIIVLFLVYKAYIPVTDSISELLEKDTGKDWQPPDGTFDRVVVNVDVLEGQDSYLITGDLEGFCDSPTEEAYCPSRLTKFVITGQTPYLSGDRFARIQNGTYAKEDKPEFFALLKKEASTGLSLNATVDYRPVDLGFARTNNLPGFLFHDYRINLDESIASASSIEPDISVFTVLVEDNDLNVNLDGQIKGSGETASVKVIVVHHFESKDMIFHEESIEVENDRFRKSFYVEDSVSGFFPVSVVLLVRTEDSYYAIEKTFQDDKLISVVYS